MSDEEKPVDSLLTQLSSPKRSARVSAIVQLSRISSDRSALRMLREMTFDADREIALFASQAVTRIQARLGEKTPADASSDGFLRESLLVPTPSEVPKLLEMIRNEPNALAEDLRPAAAEFLARFGKARDAAILKGWLEGITPFGQTSGAAASCSAVPNVAFPVLEALEILAPGEVAPLLPPLLASDQPLVRGRAILALQRIDFEEALAHLSEILVSRNPEARLAGIREAFFFPFQRVREMLLTVLSEEKDSEVVTAIETILACNPELDTVLRILDLIDMVPPPLKKGLNRIFRTVCETLRSSGVLSEAETEPKALLALWQKERLNKFLLDLEVKLTVADKERSASAEAWLAANLKIPEVAAFVQRLSLDPATEEIAKRLSGKISATSIASQGKPLPEGDKVAAKDSVSSKTSSAKAVSVSDARHLPDGSASSPKGSNIPGTLSSIISQAGAAPSGSSQITSKAANPRDLSSDEKREWLWNVEPADAVQWIDWIRKEALRGEGGCRRAAIMALTRFPPSSDDLPVAEAALDSGDSALQAAGFRLIERCDRNRLVQRLPVLLSIEAPSVRAQAVRFAFTVDERAAISTLGKMLHSSDPAQRASATASLFFAPIKSVIRLLIETLEKETNPDIARQILTVLQNNPSQEILDALDNIRRMPSPSVSMLVAQARIDLFDLLLKLNLDKPPEINDSKTYSAEGSKNADQKEKTTSVTAASTITQSSPVKQPNQDQKTSPLPISDSSVSKPKPYAVSEMRNQLRRNEVAWRSPALPDSPLYAGRGGLFATLKTVIGYGLLIFVLALAPSLFLKSSDSADDATGTPKNKIEQPAIGADGIRTGFVMGHMCRMDGKLEKVNEDGSLLIKASGKTFIASFSGSFPTITGGEEVTVEIIPYRKLKSGIIVSEGHSLKLR
ncbi:MAG: hypothetical protein HQM09_08570 [Candidatus Riflebacteria bacterium]|nr:hypothetical protein [Candidatus Riflebacteria bacterium]